MDHRWRTFSSYLRERFGERVQKIPVHTGFTCPNRDGTCGRGGCTFCNNASFSPGARPESAAPAGAVSLRSIRRQIEEGMARARRRNAAKFMVYLQAYSNTHAPRAVLEHVYDEALSHPDTVALAIGTRPDCVGDEVLDLLSAYAERHEIWLELGLQTIHDETLRRINRGHDAAAFFDAVERCRGRPLKLCVHVIVGLPGEDREKNEYTARTLARLPYHGLKLHPLHIVAETAMAEQYACGELDCIHETEFVARACDFLELTPADVVIQRLTADALGDSLIAPAWAVRKQHLLDAITREFERRGTRQGARYTGPRSR